MRMFIVCAFMVSSVVGYDYSYATKKQLTKYSPYPKLFSSRSPERVSKKILKRFKTAYPTRYPTRFSKKFLKRSKTVYPTRYPTRFSKKFLKRSKTVYPTRYPTRSKTAYPTRYPTRSKTKYPTKYPTRYPTRYPTHHPTKLPTKITDVSNCLDWTCLQWCTLYDTKMDSQYAKYGCSDDTDPCICEKTI